MKRLILVTSPPACGKSYVSKRLATNLKHVVYLDKDTLTRLSEQIFVVGHHEYDRHCDFFEKYVRDYEYLAIVDLAISALGYDDIVLIDAPFSKEIRDKAYMAALKARAGTKNARLTVIWVKTSPDICKQRMILRNSPRDKSKLEHIDEYIASINFKIPDEINDPAVVDDLLIFNNNSDAEFSASMQETLTVIEGRPEEVRV